QILEDSEQPWSVCREISPARLDLDACLHELDDVGPILLSGRFQLHVDQQWGLDHRAHRGIERAREVLLALLDREQIDGDAIDLDRNAGLHAHETARMMLE